MTPQGGHFNRSDKRVCSGKERGGRGVCTTVEGDGGCLSLDPDAGLSSLSPEVLRNGLGGRRGGMVVLSRVCYDAHATPRALGLGHASSFPHSSWPVTLSISGEVLPLSQHRSTNQSGGRACHGDLTCCVYARVSLTAAAPEIPRFESPQGDVAHELQGAGGWAHSGAIHLALFIRSPQIALPEMVKGTLF